jgi:hypothetical protein
MLNNNQINLVRNWLERRFNTMNVVYIKSGMSGVLFTVNELELAVIVDNDYNVTLAYSKYGQSYTVKGGYSLSLLENDLFKEIYA